MNFKAAVLEKLGENLVIKDIQVPKLELGQVLVKIRYSGVCRSQLMEIQGSRGVDHYLPHFLGHEGVGTVLEIGPGVSKVKIGDQVIVSWIKGLGISSKNPVFTDSNNIKINAGASTTFSQISIVSENRVFLKPNNLDDEVAVLFGCALLTGAGMVFNELTPLRNESILVLGLGGVGLSVLIAALAIEPKIIIAADTSKIKRNLARDLGVQHVLDPGDSNFTQEVMDISSGGVTKGYEAAGRVETIEKVFSCLKMSGGQLIFASHPEINSKLSLDPFEFLKGKSIRGSWGGSTNPDTDIPKFSNLLKNNSMNLNKIIGNHYPLTDINIALNNLKTGNEIRPIISME